MNDYDQWKLDSPPSYDNDVQEEFGVLDVKFEGNADQISAIEAAILELVETFDDVEVYL